ncbi:hypothetical protein HanXRQr2_Chr10g0451161 [Helianthus annuus]|uniref:Uncharacterized protein n=1 Tax=Helianthus annuus TaxID=4232 RepID=A0A9K3N555_HELAN|nr:hypothetical protein HanXRQr2_Chr10g0451161 [Helianthus annuus]KAJ0522790.1 hypothetical protein HanIR_Chr10g0486481 [Helianthus annuus]
MYSGTEYMKDNLATIPPKDQAIPNENTLWVMKVVSFVALIPQEVLATLTVATTFTWVNGQLGNGSNRLVVITLR